MRSHLFVSPSLCPSVPPRLCVAVAISSVLTAFDSLGLVPALVHFLQRNFRPGSSLLGDSFFDVSETAAEFTVRGFERAFRIHAVPAGQIGDDEEDVAEFAGDGFLLDFLTRDLIAQLANLLFEF